jgi:hypothetical protein
MAIGEEQNRWCGVCTEDTDQVCDINYAHETAQDTLFVRCTICENTSMGYLVSSIDGWNVDVWDDPIEE